MFSIADHGSWSLGVLVGIPIIAVIVLALVVFAGFAIYEGELGIGLAAVATGLIVIVAALTPLGYYPFSGEYHQYRDVSGPVQRIDSRLIGGGDKSTETKFVVRFEGDSRQFGCDDTRCAGVEAGDSLSLSCKRSWQYTGTDGYDCRFVNVEAAR